MDDSDLKKIVAELAQLQKDYAEYMRTHGFSYAEYSIPPPGSFMEHYKRRSVELAHALGAMPLDHPEEN